jgi:hypothetical protein
VPVERASVYHGPRESDRWEAFPAEFLPVHEEQLKRWERLDLSAGQRREVTHLKTQVSSLREVLRALGTERGISAGFEQENGATRDGRVMSG